MNSTPPRTNTTIELPIIVHIKRLYKILYQIGNKIPKRDKLGIHQSIENKCLFILSVCIDAALRPKNEKVVLLSQARRDIETLKHLVRMEHELGIIKEKTYLNISSLLQDISMMATGWQKSLQTQKPLL